MQLTIVGGTKEVADGGNLPQTAPDKAGKSYSFWIPLHPFPQHVLEKAVCQDPEVQGWAEVNAGAEGHEQTEQGLQEKQRDAAGSTGISQHRNQDRITFVSGKS